MKQPQNNPNTKFTKAYMLRKKDYESYTTDHLTLRLSNIESSLKYTHQEKRFHVDIIIDILNSRHQK